MSGIFSQRWNLFVAAWISWLLMTHCLRAQPASEGKIFSREVMLRDLAAKVITPGYAKLAANCGALADSIEKFNSAPDEAAFDHMRDAWKAASASVETLRCFQSGPLAERELVSAFYYWQIIPSRIESIVKDAEQPINQTMLDNAGATLKGIHAIEYLLFDLPHGAPGGLSGNSKALDLMTASPRRREYLAALAKDLANKAGQLSKDWSATGPQSAAEKFSASGQAGVNLLINQLTQSLENTLQNHLNFVLALPAPIDRQLNRIKGSRSGTSLQGVIAALEGVEKFYRGADGLGLRDSVNALNPALGARVQQQLAAAIAAAREIGVPLEQAVTDKRAALQAAAEQVHKLEILFKVDLAGALGVTITFTSGDSD